MSGQLRLGIIGVGEAGAAIAAGLRGAGLGGIVGFDIAADDPDAGPRVRAGAEGAGVALVDGPEALAAASTVIFSLATAAGASSALSGIAPYLDERHCYVDLNSISPARVAEFARRLEARGARFVDGAIMAAVLPRRHEVPILLAGRSADAIADALQPFGMHLEVIGDEPGRASAVKMFRSLVIKGIEALLLEAGLGAEAWGVTEPVLASIDGTLAGRDWREIASYSLRRVAVHGGRRSHEVEEVARTLAERGVEPLLANAVAARLRQASAAGIAEHFASARSDQGWPDDYHDALDLLRRAETAGA